MDEATHIYHGEKDEVSRCRETAIHACFYLKRTFVPFIVLALYFSFIVALLCPCSIESMRGVVERSLGRIFFPFLRYGLTYNLPVHEGKTVRCRGKNAKKWKQVFPPREVFVLLQRSTDKHTAQ